MNLYLCEKWDVRKHIACIVCARDEEEALVLAAPTASVLERLQWSADLIGIAESRVPEGVVLRVG